METIPESIEQCLQHSLEQYTAILHHSDNLVRMLDTCDYSDIGHYVEELEKMQMAARKNDEVWLFHFRDDPQQWQDNPLFVERMRIIRTILERNEALVPRLQTVMAVARAELAKLSEGRTVIAGYKPSIKRTTRQISRTA